MCTRTARCVRTSDCFIWESSQLVWEALRDPKCELELQGENFGNAQYSLAMRRLPAANEVDRWPMHPEQLIETLSHRLLLLHETGVIEHLDNRWILGTDSAQTLDWGLNLNLSASTAVGQGVGVGVGQAGTTSLQKVGTAGGSGRPPAERQARQGCVAEDHKTSCTLEFENIASVYCTVLYLYFYTVYYLK